MFTHLCTCADAFCTERERERARERARESERERERASERECERECAHAQHVAYAELADLLT
jgi:hypothetical protein